MDTGAPYNLRSYIQPMVLRKNNHGLFCICEDFEDRHDGKDEKDGKEKQEWTEIS